MRFADKLKDLRTKAGMSQPELAEASGLPLGSIRQYEQGRREPYWQVVFKLAEALGVSCEEFKGCIDAGQLDQAEGEQAEPERPAKRGRKGKGV